jgi:hypothetical protein
MSNHARLRLDLRAVRLGLWLALGMLVADGVLAQSDAADAGSAGEPEGSAAESATESEGEPELESASEPADAADSESSDAAALGSFDRTPQRCLRLSRIDRTEVLDEQTILFHMRGSAIYRNYLPEECNGLNDREPFMYNTQGMQRELCANDMIDLLHGMGTNLWRGRSCRLGQFHPTTPEEVEELKNVSRRSGIAVEPVPPAEPAETESPAEPVSPESPESPESPGEPGVPEAPAEASGAAPMLSPPPGN